MITLKDVNDILYIHDSVMNDKNFIDKEIYKAAINGERSVKIGMFSDISWFRDVDKENRNKFKQHINNVISLYTSIGFSARSIGKLKSSRGLDRDGYYYFLTGDIMISW